MYYSVLFQTILLIHISVQTDINSKYLKKAEDEFVVSKRYLLNYGSGEIDYYDEEITKLTNEITKGSYYKDWEINEYINCKSKREAADAALISMSAFMNYAEVIKHEYPTIHLDLTKLNICFNKVAVHYNKMKFEHSEKTCQMLTRYSTSDLEEINVYINMKFYDIYLFNFNLCNH
ncbi:unnamed protein product [Schistosoma margrebowiei]|uniref:Uncharacterized protein n=1 Tax=Schistosoma margrebowiei TaxID=48269 RepID=A0AA84ZUV7_9TREM|nr:unnamed protein product [Schistosoma margrebowiei]